MLLHVIVCQIGAVLQNYLPIRKWLVTYILFKVDILLTLNRLHTQGHHWESMMLIFTKLKNLVPLEQYHHTPVVFPLTTTRYGIVRIKQDELHTTPVVVLKIYILSISKKGYSQQVTINIIQSECRSRSPDVVYGPIFTRFGDILFMWNRVNTQCFPLCQWVYSIDKTLGEGQGASMSYA